MPSQNEPNDASGVPVTDSVVAKQGPAAGHGFEGPFTAAEFIERAADHDKAARNGLSAGPNVSYVRTFQACAVALRYAAERMFSPSPEYAAGFEACREAVRSLATDFGVSDAWDGYTTLREAIAAVKPKDAA